MVRSQTDPLLPRLSTCLIAFWPHAKTGTLAPEDPNSKRWSHPIVLFSCAGEFDKSQDQSPLFYSSSSCSSSSLLVRQRQEQEVVTAKGLIGAEEREKKRATTTMIIEAEEEEAMLPAKITGG